MRVLLSATSFRVCDRCTGEGIAAVSWNARYAFLQTCDACVRPSLRLFSQPSAGAMLQFLDGNEGARFHQRSRSLMGSTFFACFYGFALKLLPNTRGFLVTTGENMGVDCRRDVRA
jgi:hypothetical protein